MMNVFGNIVWLLFGGFMVALEYLIAGVVMSLTIIGIPFGLQAIKIGAMSLWPFGKTTVVLDRNMGCVSVVMNLLWLVVGGIPIVLTHLFFGVLLCLTIIGIPFGRQHFKLMALAFTPFGREIVSI